MDENNVEKQTGKYVCENCNTKFSRKFSLLRHQREVETCRKNKIRIQKSENKVCILLIF